MGHTVAYLVFHVCKKDETNKKKNAEQAIKVEKQVLKADDDCDEDYLDAFIEAVKGAGTCRYGVVDWNNKLLFVAWTPDAAKGKNKIQATDDAELSKERIIKETSSKV